MKASVLAFFLMVWIIGAFLGSTFEYHTSATWAGNSTGTGGYDQSPVTTLEFLMNINNATQRTEVLGVIPMITPNEEYFASIFRVISWQFSFLYDTNGNLAYGLVYYIVFLPFVLAGIIALVLLVYGILTGNSVVFS